MVKQETLDKQIKYLEKLILHKETGKDNFVIFGLEASLGKSVETTEIIKEYIHGLITRRFLVVKRFKDDIIQMEKEILFSLGITSENWSMWKNRLEDVANYNVLIISHERYLRLSIDPETRYWFEKDRHTLIIDELPSFPVTTINKEYLDNVKSILPWCLEDEFLEICKPIKDKINSSKNSFEKCQLKINKKTLKCFITKIQANYWGDNYNIINKFISDLEVIYSTKCICGNKNITSHNRNIKLWCLQNNIILDANARIDYRYQLMNNTEIISPEKILDHSTTIFHKVNFNSSLKNISTTTNYYETIIEQIKLYQKPDSMTLIVTKEDYVERIKSCLPNCAVTYFGNLIGKNDWRDFNQVWIINTPIYSYDNYIEHYRIFSGKELRRHSLKVSSGKFENEVFEKIRLGCIISETYQALKRINRDNSQRAEMFVVNNNNFIIGELIKELSGVTRGENIELKDIEYIKKKKPTIVDKLVDYCLNLPPNTYSKKEIREELGINKNNFSRYLNNVKMLELRETNKIYWDDYNFFVY